MSPEVTELSHYVKRRHKFTNNKGCWLTGENNDWSMYSSGRLGNKSYPLHRLSMAAFKGFSLESNMHVLHKCDIKGCFNPDHLFIGNQTDNKKDYINKRKYYVSRPFGLFLMELANELDKRLDLIGL